MNNRLKFRVWDIEEKKFLETPNGLFFKMSNSNMGLDVAEFIEAQSYFVVQQYTGIKDTKGKEIYEGDIVDASYSDGHERDSGYDWYGKFEVKFMYGGWELFNGEDYHSLYMSEHYLVKMEVFEVIGNILENPELLK